MPRAKGKAARGRASARAASCERDEAAEKLYRWEDSWQGWNANTLTLAECRFVVRRACRLFGVKPPAVVQHRAKSILWFSWYATDPDRISFQCGPSHYGGKNLAVALHEAAHHIAWKRHGWRVHDHGPTFLGIYLRLLEAARVAPAVALRASLRAAGLRWRECEPNHTGANKRA